MPNKPDAGIRWRRTSLPQLAVVAPIEPFPYKKGDADSQSCENYPEGPSRGNREGHQHETYNERDEPHHHAGEEHSLKVDPYWFGHRPSSIRVDDRCKLHGFTIYRNRYYVVLQRVPLMRRLFAIREEHLVYRIEPVLKPYEWGSKDRLQTMFPHGRAAHVTGPLAEVWFSGHPVWPSVVDGGPARSSTVDQLIRDDPTSMLGEFDSSRFGPVLPFLLKVISARRPLSLQVHPVSFRAREGFNRENRAGIASDSPSRAYRDRVEKNEMVVALDPFELSVGFAGMGVTRSVLARVRHPVAAAMLRCVEEADESPGYDGVGDDDVGDDDAMAWLSHGARARRRALGIAVTSPPRCAAGLHDALRKALAGADDGRGAAMLRHALVAADAFPGDCSPLALLLMNAVSLGRGQGMYVPAGTLHTYIGGTAVEIMTNSDTVLRAGLTVKPRHVDEALRVVDYEGDGGVRLLSFSGETPGLSVHGRAVAGAMNPGIEEFMLSWCSLPDSIGVRVGEGAGEESYVELDRGRVRVVLCVSGGVRCESTAGSLLLNPGEAALAPAVERVRVFPVPNDGDCAILMASPAI